MGWIPVSERLPAKYCEDMKSYNFQRVLATLKNGCVCEVWWTGTGFRLLEKFNFIELANNPVIAWRLLPEPYIEPRFLLEEDSICYGCKYFTGEGEDNCSTPDICIEGSMNDYRMEG